MIIIYYIIIVTFIWLLYSKNIEITIFKSYIQKETSLYQDLFAYSLLALLFPYTIYKLIKNKQIKMNTKQIKNIITIIILIVILGYTFFKIGSSFISVSNSDKTLKNQFNQKLTERTSFYDNMIKIVASKAQIAIKNDSSFQNIINIQMTGQKAGENVLMTWIQQSNPTATYSEVTKLYEQLSQYIESGRNGFFEQEKVLQSIKLQHDQLCDMFPGSIIMYVLGRDKLKYTPIQSYITENIMKTGKEDIQKLF